LASALIFKHAFFTALVVLRVTKLPCFEFLDFVKNTIELFDCKLNIVPVLEGVTADLVLHGSEVFFICTSHIYQAEEGQKSFHYILLAFRVCKQGQLKCGRIRRH
jgi:hypothetical protein